jgi:hypothetical protein
MDRIDRIKAVPACLLFHMTGPGPSRDDAVKSKSFTTKNAKNTKEKQKLVLATKGGRKR